VDDLKFLWAETKYYQVTKSFNNPISKNPEIGSILIRKDSYLEGNYLFDQDGNRVCEMRSSNQMDCTRPIPEYYYNEMVKRGMIKTK